MPRYRATITDHEGQNQTTFLQAHDAESARRILRERGFTASDVVEAPPLATNASGVSTKPQGDATGGLIPYKNPHALVAYYIGLFSLLPFLGFFFAVPALVLGIIGLRKRKEQPEIKGAVHAWIGIALGSLFTLIWGAVFIAIIVAIASGT